MANTIKPKRSYTASNTPALASGEVGVNAADGKIWIGNAAGNANVLVSSLARSDHTGTLSVANGGTGQTTANAAVNALLPTQTGNSGKYLTSNGTNTSWGAVTGGSAFTVSATAPSSPAVGDHWYDTDDAALLVYINDGNTSQWVEAGSPSVGAAAIQSGGRLTLESGVPVSSTDQTAKTTVYYTPYNGNLLSLYNGTNWNAYSFAELSLALGTLTSGKNYDVFAYVSGSTVTLELSTAWTTDTARAEAVSLLNGVYIKTSNNTRRYLGTFRTTATTTTEDSFTKRFLWNIHNQTQRPTQRFETATSWTYQAIAFRYANNSSLNRVECVFGLSSLIDLKVAAYFTAGAAPVQGSIVSIGEDSGTAASANCSIQTGATYPGAYSTTSAFLTMLPTAGYHYYSWLESAYTANPTTFYGFETLYRRIGLSGYVIN